MLVPRFHGFYWMGLTTTLTAFPTYQWRDPYVPDLNSRTGYKNWGSTVADDGSFTLEPSNPAALCAGGNWTLTRGSPPGWGWAGRMCDSKHVFICRVQGRTAPPAQG
jgi:hypothetical protein